jgi:NO-binding membrane sensor protein with MHYT domain
VPEATALRTIYTAVGARDAQRMSDQSIALVLGSGVATFLVVGMTVAELGHHWFGLPILVGLPIGALAGAIAVASVATGLSEQTPPRQRRLTGGFAGFSIGFLLGTAVAAVLLHFDPSSAAAFGAAIGIVFGVWISGRV